MRISPRSLSLDFSTADLDRRAGRTGYPEVAHAHVGALGERLIVRDEGVGLNNIGPSRASGRSPDGTARDAADESIKEAGCNEGYWRNFKQCSCSAAEDRASGSRRAPEWRKHLLKFASKDRERAPVKRQTGSHAHDPLSLAE
jgi:hypothetical protein